MPDVELKTTERRGTVRKIIRDELATGWRGDPYRLRQILEERHPSRRIGWYYLLRVIKEWGRDHDR